MIEFYKHFLIEDRKVKNFKLRKGMQILKVVFDDNDVHISRSGRKHLDIWGGKLKKLKNLLKEKSNEQD